MNKSNRTTMRPLSIYRIGICIYLGCESFSDAFGRFGQFLTSLTELVTDGRTFRGTYRRTDRPYYRDARTHLKEITSHHPLPTVHPLLSDGTRPTSPRWCTGQWTTNGSHKVSFTINTYTRACAHSGTHSHKLSYTQ